MDRDRRTSPHAPLYAMLVATEDDRDGRSRSSDRAFWVVPWLLAVVGVLVTLALSA
jgi:hypothetical protein